MRGCMLLEGLNWSDFLKGKKGKKKDLFRNSLCESQTWLMSCVRNLKLTVSTPLLVLAVHNKIPLQIKKKKTFFRNLRYNNVFVTWFKHPIVKSFSLVLSPFGHEETTVSY